MIVEDRARWLRRLEREILENEPCTCELGICASCVALVAIRDELHALENPSAVA